MASLRLFSTARTCSRLAKFRTPIRYNTTQRFRQSLLHNPETHVTTLDNGLRVATEDTSLQTATVGLFIDAGSRWENAETNGTAHFLEHMIFKGTSNRTQPQLEKEIENMGAHLNAYTSREHTVYFTKSLSVDIPQCVDILADILTNPLLPEEGLERERGVILREMEEVEKNVEEVIFDYLHETAFQGSSLAYSILGPTKNINKITRKDLKQYITTHYHPARIVLAGAGGVDHDELVKLGERHLGRLGRGMSIDSFPDLEPAFYVGSEIRVRDDAMPAAHVALAVEGVGWSHPDYLPLMVIASIVGNWDRSVGAGNNLSSKMSQMCADTDWVWSYNSFNTCYAETGLFGVYFVCDKMEIDNVVWNIQREWMRICTMVTAAQVERAKNMFKTGLFMSLNGTTPIFEDIGRQLTVYGRRVPLAEWDHRINMIDEDVIRKVATKYIFDRCPVVAGVGPIEALTDYNRMRSGMFWLRS